MPYVTRDAGGHISAVSHMAHEGYQPIAGDDPELQDFIAQFDGLAGQHISNTDLDFVRVIEDLVELLVEKGIILFTELPESAQEKVLRRQNLRSDLRNKLDLLGDD
ncbi:tryptophan synthase subunit beta like protein [Parahaliea mediterranea]|uniref:tryptophan synthase subunit beta like protein n=1 Tax=Parahaliea mediterranea TaxID=651086 RepID=UPI000E2EE736|nr:tryptophan synthase subunit beta like protein [Parahaliea mediterranea]